MTTTLSINRLINVDVVLAPAAALAQDLSTLLVLTAEDVIDVVERIRTYTTLADVATAFGTDSIAYQCALLWFSQAPQPDQIKIGRWAETATAGLLVGAPLTAAQMVMSLWTAISSGGINLTIDGTARNLTALDFTAQTNLNGVATVINNALGANGDCEWNGTNFIITSPTTGAGAYATGTLTLDTNPAYGVQASGTIQLTGNPANGNTVVIQGTTVTFVSGTPSGNQVQIAGSAALTSAALQAFLEASADSNLALFVYNTISDTTTATVRAFGTGGNSYTLTKVGANITVSGATFSGGVAADTFAINGTTVTFVNVTTSGNKVVVGATANATAANMQTFLAASADTALDDCTYSTTDNVVTITAAAAGTAGNSIALAESSSHITKSAATLLGGLQPSTVAFATAGAGTDISSMMATRSTSSGAYTADGVAAETADECVALFDAQYGQTWYAVSIPEAADGDQLLVADYIEAATNKHILGVSTQEAGVISAASTTDMAYLLSAAGYKKTLCQYSSNNAYSVCSLLGRALTVDYDGNNTVITLMFKQEPTITAENVTATQIDALEAKNCNIFVAYNNSTSIIEPGKMCSGDFIDEITGVDWMAVALQTALYNLLYTSTTKIPQTDAGNHLLVVTVEAVCAQAVANGLLAPGVWNSGGFGTLYQGDFMPKGFYVYAPPIASQSQAAREARQSVSIQIAAKLAGAVHTVDITLNVSR